LSKFGEHLDKIATSPVVPSLITDLDFASPGRYLLLTFDDGGKSALYVSDELCKRGWKAHFFIITGLIGNRTFLDMNGIKYLKSCGHVIGSHSHTHPDIFTDQPLEKMIEEWNVSCDILSQSLGSSCVSASVPGGDVSAAVLRSADLAGIRYLFTSDPALTPQKEGSCWVVGRACLKAGASVKVVEALIQFQGWKRELMLWRAKVLIKTGLLPLYRSYVRRTTREWMQ
jgi:peptidoglycan/xylan/chitin deacetylase (PgdA/CDA1 family)